MSDQLLAVPAKEELCTVDEFYARLKMCRLSFQRPHTDAYSLYQDQFGDIVPVRRPEGMSPSERVDAIRYWESLYPPKGTC